MTIQKRYETVIRQFVKEARARYPIQVEKVILYGSVARGEARGDSDIDLLVLWNGDGNEGWRAMTGLAFDIMVRTGEYLSVKVLPARELNRTNAFERTVLSEGITVA